MAAVAIAIVVPQARAQRPILLAILLLVVVPYLAYQGYRVYRSRIADERRHFREMADLHLATIEALARAIDAKDQTAHTHIRRVQMYASGLASALGMTESEIQGVRTAALLHDIGKLAVPEHILSKPGPLSADEFQKIKAHPQIGAEIISAVPFPYPVAPLILSHHERWDGKGYPRGLNGEDIPLGARILAVVDHFDAMTSDRPYHKAMGADTAIAVLQQESGRALDPRVVQTFIRLLPTLAEESERQDSATGQQIVKAAPGSSDARDQRVTSVFEDIAHAHREIYALYEIAQTMGTSLGVADTMALITSKLISLVPFTCCALFLYDEQEDLLRCRFATGVESEQFARITIRNGQGVTGWVARNRRTLVNARPIADFEAAGVATNDTALQSALVSPLVFNDRFIGALAVHHIEPDFYTDDHRRLIEGVSRQASAVIHNSIVFEQTQEDSLTDQLTGLPNTRFMFMHLARELARAERLKSEVALLVMDLDNFKLINDTYGHHVGDRALRTVASALRQAIRPYDICVRYAGDEFIVVLPGCAREEAERKRLEAQRTIDAVHFEARPGRQVPLTISVGAAIFPQDGVTYEALLATADSRMYRDKTHRKRQPRLQPLATGTDGRIVTVGSSDAPQPSDMEIQRARIGLL
jgi:diguanylate cyclase (GGDEF)-like protein/putative nucleotidyltransferase with HDIG domain